MKNPMTLILPLVLLLAFSIQSMASVCDWLGASPQIRIVHNTPLNFGKAQSLLERYTSIQHRFSPAEIVEIHSPLFFQEQVFSFNSNNEIGNLVRLEPDHGTSILENEIEISASIRINSLFESALEFVLTQYRSRRDWPESFLKKIAEQAVKDRFRSTLFVYRSGPTTEIVLPVLGTLRIVQASKKLGQTLPVDNNLTIETPFNGDLKFEIANFAISRTHNSDAFKELLIQLMIHASRAQAQPMHRPEENIYYTYADAESFRMYLSLGFRPLPPNYPSRLIHGVTFRPIGISTNGILNIPQAMKKSRSYWDESGLGSVVKFFNLLLETDNQQAWSMYKTYYAPGQFYGGF